MASNSYTLEVIANTAKYQTELAKIPGLTEKQAAAAALKMAQAQEKAQQKMADTAEKEARRAADSQIDAMDDVADAAEAAARRQSEAAEKAADGFGKVGESAGKLGGVLEMLGVEGASTIADLADAGEVAAQAFGGLGGSVTILGPLLAVLGPAAALVGGSMWVLADAAAATTDEMREGARKADEYADALDRVYDAQKGTAAVLKDLANQVAVSTGAMTKAELAASEAANKIEGEYGPELFARAQALSLAMQNLQKAQAKLADTTQSPEVHAQAYKDVNKYSAAVKEQKKAIEDLKGEMYESMGVAAGLARDQAESAETTRASARASDDLSDAERARIEEEARINAELEKQAAAQAQLLAIGDAARTATLSPLEKILEAQRQQIKQVYELRDASGDQLAAAAAESAIRLATSQQIRALYEQEIAAIQSVGEQAEITAEQRLRADLAAFDGHVVAAQAALKADNATQEELTALYEQSLQKRADLIEQYNQEAKDSHREAMAEVAANIADTFMSSVNTYANSLEQIARATSDRLSDEANNLTEAERAQLERRLEAQKKAATTGFRIQQAAEIAQATMSTVKGATEAFNSVFATVPYPANLVLAPITAGVVAAAGAAQVAAIASQAPPKFHVGSVGATSGESGSGEFLAVLQGGEGIVPRSAMADPVNQSAVATMRSGGRLDISEGITKGMDDSESTRLLRVAAKMLTEIRDNTYAGALGNPLSAFALAGKSRNRNSRPGHKVVYA